MRRLDRAQTRTDVARARATPSAQRGCARRAAPHVCLALDGARLAHHDAAPASAPFVGHPQAP